MLGSLISPVVDIVNNTLDKFVADKDLKEKLRYDINNEILISNRKELENKSKIIIAEAKGESLIQRIWRPVTALTFTALVVAHWLGFTAANLSEAEVLKLMEIVQLMIGGYVFSRGAEKVVKTWKQ